MPPVRRGHPRTESSLVAVPSGSSARPQKTQDPEQVLRQYILWHDAEGHSRKTETVYGQTPRPFFAYPKSEHQLEDLSDVKVDHLRAWLV